MEETIFTTGTVTYAIKGRDLLKRKGYKAYVERIFSGKGSAGCGYAIVVKQNGNSAERILKEAGIKILEINYR